LEWPGLQGRVMHQSLLIPDATIGFLWKAVCSETGLYRLGRGQQKRSVMNLAGALLHLETMNQARGGGEPALTN